MNHDRLAGPRYYLMSRAFSGHAPPATPSEGVTVSSAGAIAAISTLAADRPVDAIFAGHRRDPMRWFETDWEGEALGTLVLDEATLVGLSDEHLRPVPGHEDLSMEAGTYTIQVLYRSAAFAERIDTELDARFGRERESKEYVEVHIVYLAGTPPIRRRSRRGSDEMAPGRESIAQPPVEAALRSPAPRTLLDAVVDTDDGQLDLLFTDDGGHDGDPDRFFAGQVNGLVGAADPSELYLNLARRSGGSQVQVVLTDGPPAVDRGWEDVVEVSVDVPTGVTVRWATWAGEHSGDLADLPAGSYRVRVSATGRDAAAAGEFAEGILDRYLVELWAAPDEPDAILRETSENARYWHEQQGRRR